MESFQTKTKNWAKKRINDSGKEYKYNFFLRLALELYLELAIVSFLGLKYVGVSSLTQILNTILTISLILILFAYVVFIPIKIFKNFAKIRLTGVRFCQ